MQKKDQLGFKSVLSDLRARLMRDLHMTEEALLEDAHRTGELSNMPTHPADHDAEGLDEEIAITENEQFLLGEVDGALERIEAGTFGICQDCGRPIEKERLAAIPYTPWCVHCAKQHSDAFNSAH